MSPGGAAHRSKGGKTRTSAARPNPLTAVDPPARFDTAGHFANLAALVSQTRPVLESVAEAMRGALVTVIGIIHSNKMTKGSAGDKVKGGSSMLGVTRTAWAVGRDPEDKNRRYMALIKGNVLKKETGLKFTVENKVLNATTGLEAGYVVWGEEMDEDANEMLAASRETRDGSNIDKKGEIFKSPVQTALADGPKRSKEDIYQLEKQKNKRGPWFMSLPPNCGPSCRECGTSQPEDPQMPDPEVM